MEKHVVTSESVTEGHPDKLCDRIADEILDHILAEDPMARVACEVMAISGMVVIAGEISTDCTVDYSGIAREAIRQVGYDGAAGGFGGEGCAILTSIHRQSPDIALGVDGTDAAGTRGQEGAAIRG